MLDACIGSSSQSGFSLLLFAFLTLTAGCRWPHWSHHYRPTYLILFYFFHIFRNAAGVPISHCSHPTIMSQGSKAANRLSVLFFPPPHSTDIVHISLAGLWSGPPHNEYLCCLFFQCILDSSNDFKLGRCLQGLTFLIIVGFNLWQSGIWIVLWMPICFCCLQKVYDVSGQVQLNVYNSSV